MDEQIIQNAYESSQMAIARLKSAIRSALMSVRPKGLRNAQIGKLLGIYRGHIGHEGHISRSLLAIMEEEGVVCQNSQTKRWYLRQVDESLIDKRSSDGS